MKKEKEMEMETTKGRKDETTRRKDRRRCAFYAGHKLCRVKFNVYEKCEGAKGCPFYLEEKK